MAFPLYTYQQCKYIQIYKYAIYFNALVNLHYEMNSRAICKKKAP